VLNAAGLALEQAPPIGVPLRFFVTAPAYLVAAGLLLVVEGADVLASRWTPGALALVHLTLLGFLSQVMFGALLQLFPVLAGAPVPRVLGVSRWLYGLLNLGVPLQCFGFLSGERWWLLLGSALVAAAVLLFLTAAGASLARAKGDRPTVLGMRLSLLALVVTVGLGLWLVLGLTGTLSIPDFAGWTNVHLSWGLFGWAGILLMAVSYQVLPLFYLAPEIPLPVRRFLAPGQIGGLALVVAAQIGGLAADWGGGLLAGGFLVYVGVTYWTLGKRKRSRPDVTLDYWRVGLLALVAAILSGYLGLPATVVGVLLILGALVGIATGMLYKIVPFLAWFHLQQAQIQGQRMAVRVPHTGLLLSARWARAQWALQMAALAVLLGAPLGGGPALRAGGALLVLAAALLGWNLVRTLGQYRLVRAALSAGPTAEASS
jgi:hypothetical protein